MLPSLLLVFFCFLAASKLLDRAPSGKTAKRWTRAFFNTTLLKPSRRRGAFFGLWFFLFVMALISTLGLLLFPSDEGMKGVLVLWAIVLVGRFLLTRSYQLSGSRRGYLLPQRHKRM